MLPGLSQLSQSFGQGSPNFGGSGTMGGGPGYSSGYGHAPNSHHWHQDKDTSDHLDHISKGGMKIVKAGFFTGVASGVDKKQREWEINSFCT